MLWCSVIIPAPRSGLDYRTTSIARWHGRRPSAIAAVVFHRRDRRSGGASNSLVCDSLVHLVDDMSCRLKRAELGVVCSDSVRHHSIGQVPDHSFLGCQRYFASFLSSLCRNTIQYTSPSLKPQAYGQEMQGRRTGTPRFWPAGKPSWWDIPRGTGNLSGRSQPFAAWPAPVAAPRRSSGER